MKRTLSGSKQQCRVCGVFTIRWTFQSSLPLQIYPPSSRIVTILFRHNGKSVTGSQNVPPQLSTTTWLTVSTCLKMKASKRRRTFSTCRRLTHAKCTLIFKNEQWLVDDCSFNAFVNPSFIGIKLKLSSCNLSWPLFLSCKKKSLEVNFYFTDLQLVPFLLTLTIKLS